MKMSFLDLGEISMDFQSSDLFRRFLVIVSVFGGLAADVGDKNMKKWKGWDVDGAQGVSFENIEW